jgi:Zn-dependent peptidase ImmA (M78 family)
MAPRYKEAKLKAEELLKSGKVKSAPVDVERLAKVVSAKIHYEPLENEISGMVTRTEDGAALIGVNESHHPNRQRFTIAHEIGHLLLHDDQLLHIDRTFPIALRSTTASLGTDAMEIEANQFAAELLMPTELVRKDVDKLLNKVEPEKAVEDLAAKYKVSVQAMTIRLNVLGFLS